MKEKISKAKLVRLWNMVYNISLSMLLNPGDAEDATQEVFIKVQEKLHTFRGDSKLETWVYRITCNHLLNIRKRAPKEPISFEFFEQDISHFTPYDNEFSLSNKEEERLVSDIKVGCTTAMLQCLDEENRFIIIIGTIFNINSKDASSICNLNEATYRQRLSRSKKKLGSFMKKSCGLINPDATCKCRKRLLIAVERGRLDLKSSAFEKTSPKITALVSEMNEMDEISQIYQDNPFIERDTLFLPLLKNKYKILNDELLLS